MSQQSLRQASIRAVTSTTYTYEGDWHALWDLLGIAAGTFNERMLLYINNQLSTSYTELNSAMAAFAAEHGSTTFQAIGTFTPGFSLTAPVLAFASATNPSNDNTQDLTADFADSIVGNVIRLVGTFGSATVSEPYDIDASNTIDAGEDSAQEAAFTTGAIDDGVCSFKCRVEDGSGNALSDWSNTVSKTIATAVAPVNTVAPVVSAGALFLTTTDGTWTGTPAPTFAYQWKRGVTNVGTNSNSYTPVAADAGQSMTCVVTGTNASGSADGTSNAISMATNMLQKTQVLNNAYWTPNNATLDTDTSATTDPFGTNTAEKLKESAVTAKHEIYVTGQVGGLGFGSTYTISACFKQAERSIVILDSGFSKLAWFDISGGTVLTQTGCTGTITSLGNGWYRCSITFTATGGTGNAVPAVSTTDGVTSYLGVTGNGAYITCLMMQTGGTLSTYVPVA